jgi:hypothetical protein
MLRAIPRRPARYDFPAFRNEALQSPDVFVIDSEGFVGAKATYFAAAAAAAPRASALASATIAATALALAIAIWARAARPAMALSLFVHSFVSHGPLILKVFLLIYSCSLPQSIAIPVSMLAVG